MSAAKPTSNQKGGAPSKRRRSTSPKNKEKGEGVKADNGTTAEASAAATEPESQSTNGEGGMEVVTPEVVVTTEHPSDTSDNNANNNGNGRKPIDPDRQAKIEAANARNREIREAQLRASGEQVMEDEEPTMESQGGPTSQEPAKQLPLGHIMAFFAGALIAVLVTTSLPQWKSGEKSPKTATTSNQEVVTEVNALKERNEKLARSLSAMHTSNQQLQRQLSASQARLAVATKSKVQPKASNRQQATTVHTAKAPVVRHQPVVVAKAPVVRHRARLARHNGGTTPRSVRPSVDSFDQETTWAEENRLTGGGNISQNWGEPQVSQ